MITRSWLGTCPQLAYGYGPCCPEGPCNRTDRTRESRARSRVTRVGRHGLAQAQQAEAAKTNRKEEMRGIQIQQLQNLPESHTYGTATEASPHMWMWLATSNLSATRTNWGIIYYHYESGKNFDQRKKLAKLWPQTNETRPNQASGKETCMYYVRYVRVE